MLLIQKLFYGQIPDSNGEKDGKETTRCKRIFVFTELLVFTSTCIDLPNHPLTAHN